MQQGAAELSSDYLWFIEYVNNKLSYYKNVKQA